MIRIDKTGCDTPNTLLTLGVAQRQLDCDAYCADYVRVSPARNEVFSRFVFDSEIYGAIDVKTSLLTLQSGKCCFCEARMLHVDDGDVEHFRPKGMWKQGNGADIHYPGYYWLAYDWNNLYLSCGKCNQRNKLSKFPIDPNSTRALDHNDDISLEVPLFVDPGDLNDDPENHIEFHNQYISPKTDKGLSTITEIGLDRPELDEDRWSVLDKLIGLENSYLLTCGYPPEAQCLENFLDRLRPHFLGSEEYSNMIRCRFKQYEALL